MEWTVMPPSKLFGHSYGKLSHDTKTINNVKGQRGQ